MGATIVPISSTNGRSKDDGPCWACDYALLALGESWGVFDYGCTTIVDPVANLMPGWRILKFDLCQKTHLHLFDFDGKLLKRGPDGR